mmetsp:Transcript_25949/g.58201  ORF Transcript_25949/g.58201 Transcript_25949/m.58201 type:complete len:138 (+) Transcript_25949:1137-1550(+)
MNGGRRFLPRLVGKVELGFCPTTTWPLGDRARALTMMFSTKRTRPPSMILMAGHKRDLSEATAHVVELIITRRDKSGSREVGGKVRVREKKREVYLMLEVEQEKVEAFAIVKNAEMTPKKGGEILVARKSKTGMHGR